MPILEDRVSAVHSLENVRHLAIKRLRSLPQQNAVVKGGSNPSFDIRTIEIKPLAAHPDSRKSFVERTMRKSGYAIRRTEAKKQIADRHVLFFQTIQEWKDAPLFEDKSEDWLGT